MFQSNSLDGEKHRLVESSQPYVAEILESREPQNGKTSDQVGRLQHTVISGLLVYRYLPPASLGQRWPHDTLADAWWEVVSHPPHGGIVADFNKALGGAYPRVLNPKHQVVAFADQGEEVLLEGGKYKVTRSGDKQTLDASGLEALRSVYYAAQAA